LVPECLGRELARGRGAKGGVTGSGRGKRAVRSNESKLSPGENVYIAGLQGIRYVLLTVGRQLIEKKAPYWRGEGGQTKKNLTLKKIRRRCIGKNNMASNQVVS